MLIRAQGVSDCPLDLSFAYTMSASDPLFYLHHANLDRIWWNWQMLDLPNRLHDITGRTTWGPPYRNVTLDFPLNMGTEAPVVSIRDVVDIRKDILSYSYIKWWVHGIRSIFSFLTLNILIQSTEIMEYESRISRSLGLFPEDLQIFSLIHPPISCDDLYYHISTNELHLS